MKTLHYHRQYDIAEFDFMKHRSVVRHLRMKSVAKLLVEAKTDNSNNNNTFCKHLI